MFHNRRLVTLGWLVLLQSKMNPLLRSMFPAVERTCYSPPLLLD